MGMLKRDHIRTMLAMPAIQRQWQENQGPPMRPPWRKSMASLRTPSWRAWRTTPPPSPGWWRPWRPSGPGDPHWLHHRLHRSDDGRGDPGAARQGYAPDAWFSPDSVQGLGRPYPYMIYANMAQFQIPSVADVVKVGDTVADIQEGKNAGILSLGCWRAAASWASPRRSTRPSRPRTGSVSWPGPRRPSWPAGPTAFC